MKQLETIAATLEESKFLNNTIESALCWCYNAHARVPEWQIKICEKFASQEAIDEMIQKGLFYYAPTHLEKFIYNSDKLNEAMGDLSDDSVDGNKSIVEEGNKSMYVDSNKSVGDFGNGKVLFCSNAQINKSLGGDK